MPKIILSKQEVIKILLETFRKKGYEGTSLADMSEATGLSKASLYHHFKNGKEEMALSAISLVGNWLKENIVDKLYDESIPPNKKLNTMINAIDDFYSHGSLNCLLGSFNTTEAKNLFQEYLAGAAQAWLDAIQHVFIQKGLTKKRAEKVAMEFLIKIQGCLIMSRVLNDNSVYLSTIADLKREYIS